MKHYLLLFAAISIANPLPYAQAEQLPPNIVFFLVERYQGGIELGQNPYGYWSHDG